MTTTQIDRYHQLMGNPDWQEAVIVYSGSNWLNAATGQSLYTEEQRSYKIVNGQWGFDSDKSGCCVMGDCLDGSEKGVRLDTYQWKIERVYITKNKIQLNAEKIQCIEKIESFIYTEAYDNLTDYLQGIRDMIHMLNGDKDASELFETVLNNFNELQKRS